MARSCGTDDDVGSMTRGTISVAFDIKMPVRATELAFWLDAPQSAMQAVSLELISYR